MVGVARGGEERRAVSVAVGGEGRVVGVAGVGK